VPGPAFQRLFNPLGMTSTSWRDDHTRIVPRRALAYERQDDGYHLDLPFENVYGNGGLLTTVGDLLKWTRNFQSPVVGDAAFVLEQTTPGRFSDGRAHDYGMGVWVDTYRPKSMAQTKLFNDVLRERAANRPNTTVASWFDVASADPKELISKDQVHPTEAGQAAFAQLVGDSIAALR